MGFFIGLGLAGFTIVLVFFTKLTSLDPRVRAAVIGVRIILLLCVLFGVWWWNYDQKKDGRDFFGDLKINRYMLIGQWRTSYTTTEDKEFSTIFSLYPDSTLYDANDESKGKWQYDARNEKLYLYFDNIVAELYFDTFDGTKITTSNSNGQLIKVSNVPENLASLKKSAPKPPQNIQVEKLEVAQASNSYLEGQWSLKMVSASGVLTDDLGVYNLNKDGTGTYNDETPIKYKLDQTKQRFTISRPDEVIVLNIKSYDKEVLIGYPNEEPDHKYIFTKGL